MQRSEKIILWVIGTIEDTIRKQIPEADVMTYKGRLAYREMVAEGFTPTDEEADLAYTYLKEDTNLIEKIESEYNVLVVDQSSFHRN